jgi:hypothetical protein
MSSIKNPGSGDGSAPAIGELVSESSGAKPSQRPVAPAGFSQSNFGSGPSADRYREHAAAGARAAGAVNDGAPDDSGPVPGLDAPTPPGGSGVTGSGNTWADSSSLTSQR